MDKTEKSAYRNNWIAEKLDRVNLTMPKGKKEQVKEVADKVGLSLNAYINQAIDEKMERDNAEQPPSPLCRKNQKQKDVAGRQGIGFG